MIGWRPAEEVVASELRVPGGIAVGIDGSAGGTRALDWAAREAVARGRALHVVVAAPNSPLPDGGTVPGADRTLAEANARCTRRYPDLPVTGAVWLGTPAAALLAEAAQADLLVVGASGRGGKVGMHVGSVPATIVRHAPCAVVVVRGGHAGHPPAWDGDTLVGIDGSDHDDAVLAAAFHAAATRSGRLAIVHAEARPDSQLVHAAAARWAGSYPDVDVVTREIREGAIHTLADLTRDAALLTVGSRGRGGFPTLLLGSVPRAMVNQAGCPVQVVRLRMPEFGWQ